jgi:hypothetical protein
LVKTYNGITLLIAKTKQRLVSIPGEERSEDFDSFLKGEKNLEGLETVKGRIAREIEKHLKYWDIWTEWLSNVPGIGPWIAGQLIIYYYYRFIPVCQHCGSDLKHSEEESNGNGNGNGSKESKAVAKFVCSSCGKNAKGDGVLKHRMELKDFPNISKWWAYMGRHVIEGKVPKRKKGVKANWGTPKRTLGYQIGEQFNRQEANNPYKKFLLERKSKHERNHLEWSKGHRHNAAKNEAIKLFLSHFWVVARTLDGKDISMPYAGQIMGHTDIIGPFFWDKERV